MKKLIQIQLSLAGLLSLFCLQHGAVAATLQVDNVSVTDNLTLLGTVSGNVGDLTTSTTGVSITGGTDVLLGSAGAAINIQTATDSQPGLLSAADHAAFSATHASALTVLTANLTLYVMTTGSDANNGSASNSANAFLTIQRAAYYVAHTYFVPRGITVFIQCGTGTYATTSTSTLPPFCGGGVVAIQGDPGHPDNCILSGYGTMDILRAMGPGGLWHVEGFKVIGTSGSAGTKGFVAGQNSWLQFKNVNFGPYCDWHLWAAANGIICATGNYTISGGAAGGHMKAIYRASIIINEGTIVTVSGTPSLPYFVVAANCSTVQAYTVTYSGSATGRPYRTDNCSYIQTGATGSPNHETYFPGTGAGAGEKVNNGIYD